MENKNGFSFGASSKNYETEKLNSDYLELLSETPVSEEEVYGEESRDIYSSSDKGVNTRSFKDDYENLECYFFENCDCWSLGWCKNDGYCILIFVNL